MAGAASDTGTAGNLNTGFDQVVAVVLAGGFGTRVRHLLPGVPKPMALVAGKPFLEWVVRYLARQGLRQVILSTGYLSEVIEQHFQTQPIEGMVIRCAPETQPLGTAGGFLNAVQLAAESPHTWVVLNGDSLAFADLTAAAAELRDPATAGVLIGSPVPDASRYGTLALGPKRQLLGFEEKRPGKGIISAGMYLLRDSLVRGFPASRPLSFEQDVFPRCIQQGATLKTCVADAPFLDIGTPETLRQAQAFVEQNRDQFFD
jgi:NDP-sugar pyrophosphorylase family protein